MTRGYNFAPLMQGLDSVQRQMNLNDQRDMQYERMEEDDYRFGVQQDAREKAAAAAENHRNAMLGFEQKKFNANQGHRNAMLGLQKQKMAQAGVSSNSYGKSPVVIQNPDGTYTAWQFGSGGKPPIRHNFNAGASPHRGVAMVDDGTGTQIINKSDGQPVRRIQKDIAGAAAQKKIGAHQGTLAANKNKATSSYWSKSEQNQSVIGSIDSALKGIRWGTVGWRGAVGQYVPGSDAYNLKQRLLTVKGNIGFDKLQDMRDNSPTGGALGQVSEMELKTLQSVWGSVEQSQSESELRRNLMKFKKVYQNSKKRIRQAYKMDYGNYPPEMEAGSAAPVVSQGGFTIRRLDD